MPCAGEVPSLLHSSDFSVIEGLNAYYLFVAFSSCQSDASGLGVCFVSPSLCLCRMLHLAVITVPSLSWHENICCLSAISTSPISFENFMDRDDLLFSIASHASQCTQLFSCFPPSLHPSLFSISISNALSISTHLLIKSISRLPPPLCRGRCKHSAFAPKFPDSFPLLARFIFQLTSEVFVPLI